ncbi:laccase domain-containing protein, partial [Stenotrophomonas sp. SrG]|uniref:laccase domain-containing protein n=1 Tax=Stenotrophomonas sp. SrG TaxID=3414430 RepID=UPI003CF61194
VFAACADLDAGAADAFVATRPGHWKVDLDALARRRLVAAGVDPGGISGGQRSTIAERERFFSHRRDGRTGRMATLAWLA